MTTAVRTRRRELHAANAQSFSTDGAKQILMAYRGNRHAAVARGFEFKPGFIYCSVRAISARINQNFDGWPSGELIKSYRTFIGKPCFVNHQNFDPKKARGKVVAARYIEAGDDKYVETVMEIDAQRFPKLAKEIKEGGMDSVSMGVEAGFTICSYCGNRAVDVPEFCEHVKYHKGQRLGRVNEKTGAVEPVMVYEKCFKLGFFELSFVFDPADETAVVSRVIAASHRQATEYSGEGDVQKESGPFAESGGQFPVGTQKDLNDAKAVANFPSVQAKHPGIKKKLQEIEARIERLAQDPTAQPPGSIVPGQMPTSEMPTELPPTALPSTGQMPTAGKRDPLAVFEARIHRLAYGEIEAPAQVDTLRDEDDGASKFKSYVKSPQELQDPDLDQAQRLDRDQESEGLDANRRVEDVETISGPSNQGVPMPTRNGRRRTARPRYADEDPMAALLGGGGPPPDDGGGMPPDGGDAGPPPDDGGGGQPQSDEELIAEAEKDLAMAEQEEAGEDEGLPPEEGDEGLPPEEEGDEELPPEEGEEDLGEEGPPPEEDSGEGDLPPWLTGGGEEEEDQGPPPPPELTARRNGNRRSSTQKKRRKGTPMSLAQRTRTAAAQRPRHHYADDSGHFDGGPYGEDNQGEQEEVFLSQTPSAEGVADPTPGDGTISNTENNLVARIQRRSNDLRRDMIAYEQITGRRLQGGPEEGSLDPGYGPPPGSPTGSTLEEGSLPSGFGPPPGSPTGSTLEEGSLPSGFGPPSGSPTGSTIGGGDHMDHLHQGRRYYGEAVDSPDEVNPTVNTGPAGEEQTGDDFESLGEEPTETQPKDASVHAFRAFDAWLRQTTGRTARQHGNSNFIRRSAARYCSAKGWDPAVMFPTLGNVLREARRNEGTNRRANMRRYADDKLDVAAPQDRIDVEAPVSGTTDADAQASQFDLGDFGDNAGDNLADPDLSVDTQIWAPGEGDSSTKSSNINRRADGITAVRYAEAYIRAGLAPNTSEEKWKIAGLAQTMRLGTIRDRISMLDAVNAVTAQRQASTRRTAGINRGAGNSVPPGFGQRQLTAGTAREAANDISTDSAMFLK